MQLLRLRPAFAGCDVTYATVNRDYASEIPGQRFRLIVDANREQKVRLARSCFSIFRTVLSVRPDVVISTGAAPGYFAIRVGRLLGKTTIWVDSIANAEELSMSGRKAGKYASLWLTQWEHLARPEGPACFGNVLGELPAREPAPAGQAATGGRPLKLFVTVGSDVPFDRLVRTVDAWLGRSPVKHEAFAQIGRSTYRPQHMTAAQFLTPAAFQEKLAACDLVVAHAGMGTILSALRQRKPILTLPRHGSLGETRNDHQIATTRHLLRLNAIDAAFSEEELLARLDAAGSLASATRISDFAPDSFTSRLNEYIHARRASRAR